MAELKLEQKLREMEYKAEDYLKKYPEQIHTLESYTILGKTRGVQAWDVVQLGKQLEKWEMLEAMVKEEGGLSALGALPKVAFDVITVAYGNSVIPFIASVQNIEEERGNVYFKVIKRNDTGSTIIDPRTGMVMPSGLATNLVQDLKVAEGDGTTTNFSISLSNVPVRPETFEVKAKDVYGKDDGKGNILGIGVWGTIDYNSGAVNLTFATAPASGVDITVSYQVDVEAKDDLPSIGSVFEAVPITAHIYALKGVVGLLQAYALRQRFGIVAEDELAKDLVVAINNEIGGDLIRKYNAKAKSSVTWNKTPPSGVSYFEHKQTVKDAIADLEGQMVQKAGRGVINVLIAGSSVAAILSTLPGFEKIADGKSMGAHVFGTLDGVTIIRVNDTSTLAPNVAIGIYNPENNPFEGAGVYAPYMPLTTTELIPLGPNPLTNQRAVAVWAGVEVLVPELVAKLEVNA